MRQDTYAEDGRIYNAWKHERLCHKDTYRPFGTYIDLLPLADVSYKPRKPKESDQRKEFGKAQDTQGPARVEDLEAVSEILELKLEKINNYLCI